MARRRTCSSRSASSRSSTSASTRSSRDHTGQTAKKVAADTERDYFISAEQAKAYGIIDEVYAERDESLISETRTERSKSGEKVALGEKVTTG